jgi:hypothetical protein
MHQRPSPPAIVTHHPTVPARGIAELVAGCRASERTGATHDGHLVKTCLTGCRPSVPSAGGYDAAAHRQERALLRIERKLRIAERAAFYDRYGRHGGER